MNVIEVWPQASNLRGKTPNTRQASTRIDGEPGRHMTSMGRHGLSELTSNVVILIIMLLSYGIYFLLFFHIIFPKSCILCKYTEPRYEYGKHTAYVIGYRLKPQGT